MEEYYAMGRIALVVLGTVIFTTIITTHMAAEAQKEGALSASRAHTKSYAQLGAAEDTSMSKEKEWVIFDFAKPDDLNKWRPINDTVMGGISDSSLQRTEGGKALFTGYVSLENNGGFASVQSQPSFYNLEGFDGIAIRVKGDGKRYKISLKNSVYMASPRYQAPFNTEKEAWTTINLPFHTLVPTMHGNVLENEPPINVSKIISFVLLISDKQEGPFSLEIDWIKAYRN
jgi:monofunctional biosynthetic peptidoglycan transglycosylase